jgi:murein DD-endopeptidase MepM/ murein hydrolase activator NlpD
MNIAAYHRGIAGVFARKAASEPFWLMWPVANAEISQPFGANPEYYGRWFKDINGRPLGHEGIDLADKGILGRVVWAAAAGRVYRVETLDNSNYGLQVRIEHPEGYKTVYAHLMAVSVKVGDIIGRGSIIGRVGNTGNSTGPHLHFVLKKKGATASGESRYVGNAQDIVDPIPYLWKA